MEYFKKGFVYTQEETDRLLLWETSSVSVAKYGAGMHSGTAQGNARCSNLHEFWGALDTHFVLLAFLSVSFSKVDPAFSKHGLYVCVEWASIVFNSWFKIQYCVSSFETF